MPRGHLTSPHLTSSRSNNLSEVQKQAINRRIFDCYNQRDLQPLDELLDTDCVEHTAARALPRRA